MNQPAGFRLVVRTSDGRLLVEGRFEALAADPLDDEPGFFVLGQDEQGRRVQLRLEPGLLEGSRD